jgi:Arc/MetJ-type ribon-helix-helix transcriptional regulator
MVRSGRRENSTSITVRIPGYMAKLLQEELGKDTHFNISEFVRDAIRRELERRGRL